MQQTRVLQIPRRLEEGGIHLGGRFPVPQQGLRQKAALLQRRSGAGEGIRQVIQYILNPGRVLLQRQARLPVGLQPGDPHQQRRAQQQRNQADRQKGDHQPHTKGAGKRSLHHAPSFPKKDQSDKTAARFSLAHPMS